MRILHILDHSLPLHSGYTFRTCAILEQQRKLGFETFQLTSPKHRGNGTPIETVSGFDFYRTPSLSSWLSRLPLINQWAVVRALEKRLDELIPQLKPDVLHAHSPALNGWAAIRAGGRHRLPVVYECRAFWEDAAVDHGTAREGGLRYRLTRALETHVFRRADAVTTICEGLKRDIASRGIAESKITVIPNAVDISRFPFGREPDQALCRDLGLEGKTVLGFIGSFYAYEGLTLLLEALPKILACQPDARLLLVGGGPQAEILQDASRTLGVEEAVIFPGRVPHDRVQQYYDLVDIFVYPRLPMRLTDLVTPLKPLEAMAQGKLVLASDVGGHRELIRSGENGILFQAGDSNALSTAILEAMGHRDRWPSILQAGRQFVEEERSWAVSVAKYEDVYHSLK
ncbi:MAG: TIGR04063 family PEP-CTERM/XrtA system glycosyltransferase [Methylohalobius sp. ZOD2]